MVLSSHYFQPKILVFANGLLRMKQDAGLGCPPVQYTTNRNESMNRFAQEYANFSRSTWVQLANNMYALKINEQKRS